VNTSTVSPVIQLRNEHKASLQPMLVTVCFSGTLPNHLVDADIPIQISIAMAEEHRSFMKPVVQVISWNVCESEDSLNSGDTSLQSTHQPSEPHGDVLIPFLPLPHTFNHSDQNHWTVLAHNIQDWLVTMAHLESQQWTWGRDAFWLAFVAANPEFPNGKWAEWDPRIPLEGEFIERWM
ncbi:hypothetical protein BV22DRAFT_985002, partial [Leucogyrophana mollusca]